MTKNNILHYTIGRFQLVVAVLLSLATGSCTTDETSGRDDDQPVIVTAYATESALMRGAVEYDDHGDVKNGTYYLTYPKNSSDVNMAKVVFNNSEYAEATVMPDMGPLTWKQIWNGTTSDRTLGLTNVSPEEHNNYDKDNPYKNPIIFKEGTQFAAGRYIPYGDEENTNDILLASKSPYRNETTQDHTSNYIHFELHHCMARVRVIVETHPTGGSFDLLDGVLDEAKVDITNVVHKPYSFKPYIGASTNFSDVVAISKDGTLDNCKFEKINLLNTLDTDGDAKWQETGLLDDQDSYPGGKYFTTYDILLPPQQLRTDDERPRLVITVKDDTKTNGIKTYSGVLPHIMEDKEGNPLQFEFLAEHLLTIRTVISNDPPELIFMPVKVVEWVDKGTYSLDAQQAGIYDKDDFMQMVECYENYDEGYNKTKLYQFGTFKNGKWVFEIFRNLSLSREEIEGKMKVEGEKPDYSFDFNTWYTVTVDDEQVSKEKLKSILSGVPEEEPKDESDTDTDSQS